MRISNVDLRKQMFGASPQPARAQAGQSVAAQPKTAPKSERLKPPPRPQGRGGMLAALAQAGGDEVIRPDPPGLAARMQARALLQRRADPPGRLVFADAGKGVAVLLVIFAAIMRAAGGMPEGFGFLSQIEGFLYPFAIPALLLFAGMFMRDSRNAPWSAYFARKLATPLLILAAWAAAVLGLSLLSGALTESFSLATISAALRGQIGLVVALAALALFMVIWKVLGRFRTGTIFVLAAFLEILHTEQGHVFWIEAMRGLVYFAAGHCLAPNLRALARFTRENAASAAAILAVWAAFNALMTSADLPLAYGEKISTLPFASLGLGLAGASAMVIAGELIAGSRMGVVFAVIGRRWMAFYAALPLACVSLAGMMTAAGLFATPAHAVAALLLAALAAGLALVLLELREPAESAQPRGAQTL